MGVRTMTIPKSPRALPTLLLLALAPACVIDVGVDETVDSRVRFEVDLQGECEGEGEIEADGGTSRWTKTLEDDGTVCRVDIEWEGVLVDIPGLREDIEKDVDIDDVTIESLVMTLETAALADADGKVVNPPLVPYWSAVMEAEGRPLLDLEREGVEDLVGERIDLEVDDELVRITDDALHDNEAMRGAASTTLRVFTTDLEALQAAPGPVGVQVDILSTISANAEVRPLQR